MKKTAITGGTLITPFRQIPEGGLIIENGTITAVFTGTPPLEAEEIIDVKGAYVSPGFIDIHTHGGGGHDFMDGTPEAIIEAAKSHLRHGTTALCPTTLTSTDEDLFLTFSCYEKALEQMKDGPELLGLHLEGPYFSPSQAGAQDPRFLKNPAPYHYMDILRRNSHIVRVSAAPELPGALELGRYLRSQGILAAIGHSDALYEDVAAALECGYTHVTHLYSGMSSLRRIQAYRHLGVVESAYLLDGLTVEIIADGCHLPPELLKLILKCKSLNNICLITDSMRGAGMPEGSHVLLGSLKNGQDTIIDNGVAVLPDRSAFAGSVCTADRCIRTMYHLAETSLTDAVRMMTYNPARIMKAEHRIGSLAAGMDADLCIFDDDIRIKEVFVKGKRISIQEEPDCAGFGYGETPA